MPTYGSGFFPWQGSLWDAVGLLYLMLHSLLHILRQRADIHHMFLTEAVLQPDVGERTCSHLRTKGGGKKRKMHQKGSFLEGRLLQWYGPEEGCSSSNMLIDVHFL